MLPIFFFFIFFSSRVPISRSVVILDEISDKCKNSHQMVKEVFQWVATVKNHPLIVIGVANVLVDVSDSAFRDFVQCTFSFCYTKEADCIFGYFF